MERKHALLSASGATRWLTCTPSPRMEQKYPESESVYADEGTLAHEVSEWMIRHKAYGIDIDAKLDALAQHELITSGKVSFDEIINYANDYALFVVEKVREAPPGTRLIQEQRLDLTAYIPEGFGTTDVAIVGDHWLEVIDLKYGKGVPVDAYENSQMKVYALGALQVYELLYNIENVRMTIYQPRINNISSFEISVFDLKKWAREVLQVRAKMAFEGEGDLVAGDHCRFCRARAMCAENARYNLVLAKREFQITEVTDEQIVKLLKRADGIKNWIKAVEDKALELAIQGKKWPGMKLVEGRSNRKYANESKIIEALKAEGFKEDDLVKKKIVGITELSKKVKKPIFEKCVDPYIVKPPGSPTLVTEDDKRPEYDRYASAIEDFKTETDE